MQPMKWRIEGYEPNTGEWRLHSIFKGSVAEVKQKCLDVFGKTKYHGIRFKEEF